jgi:beta-glucosidase
MQGLTFWSPNINIFRDPRWGRGQETYGEDPYLSGEMGVAFVHGLQGDDPKYLIAAACAKHFAVHSGPEKDRHTLDPRVSLRELNDTYRGPSTIITGKVYSALGYGSRGGHDPLSTDHHTPRPEIRLKDYEIRILARL